VLPQLHRRRRNNKRETLTEHVAGKRMERRFILFSFLAVG
jgi:hypothetical protein